MTTTKCDYCNKKLSTIETNKYCYICLDALISKFIDIAENTPADTHSLDVLHSFLDLYIEYRNPELQTI